MSELRYKDKEQDEDNFEAGFTIPQAKSVISGISDTLLKAHQAEEEDNKKKGKKAKPKRKGTICCCGSPGCSIGPMIEKEEETA